MPVSSLRVGRYIRLFWSWWCKELGALWAPFSNRVAKTKAGLTLDTTGRLWTLTHHKGSQLRPLGQALFDDVNSADQQKAISSMVRKAKAYGSRLKVLLASDTVLRKILEMPLVADVDLRQALYFEIDRQTPFCPDDVYFDYRVIEKRPQLKRVTLELTVVPRGIADEILGKVEALGFRPSGLDVAIGSTPGGSGINLLKPQEPGARRQRSSLSWAFVACQMILLIAVVYIPVSQLSALDASLDAEVAQAKDKAQRTLSTRNELDRSIKAASFLDQKKLQAPTIILVLNELTKAIPDNTWLSTISEDNNEFKISGYSTAAAELISALDSAPIFKDPAFSSPIVQDPQTKLERFDITVKTKKADEK